MARIPLSTASCTAFALAALAGCVKEPEGLYVVFLDPPGEVTCTTEMSEDYEDDRTQDGGGGSSEWTYTTTVDQSGSAFYFELIPLADGTWVLNYGGELIPGTDEGGGSYKFQWESFLETTETEDHRDGYAFVYKTSASTTTTVNIDRDAKGYLTGSWKTTGVNEERWREDDRWDPADNDLYSTQIPSDQYLFDGDGDPVVNDPETTDCSQDECFIVLTTTCDDSAGFEAVRTDPETAGDFLLPANTAS